jgi:hypothetical protein
MRKESGKFWLLFAAVAVVGIVAACTADDDLWGLEDETKTSFDGKTRAESSDTMKYLSISTYDSEKWTDMDYEIMDEAADRIGVSFSEVKNKYVFDKSSAKGINMSDSLYELVCSQFELTNQIMNENKKKVARKKVKSGDVSSTLPDCVPVAISHMGQGAPTYENAVAACDKYAKGWRTSGGVPSSKVGPIINKFTSVTTKTSVTDSCDVDLNYCVLLINQGGNVDHAVNAKKYEHSSRKFYYKDFGKNATGTVDVSLVTAFYPFNNEESK